MTKIDLLQYAGAGLLLLSFIALLFRVINLDSITYLTMNAIGAGWLAVVAFVTSQWGFFILEGVWSAVSIVDLAKKLIARRRNGLAKSQDSHLRAKMRLPSPPN